MQKRAHITIAGDPFCGWLGCAAGQDIAKKAAARLGVHAADIRCGHGSIAQAQRVARALRPSFRRGAVRVVPSDCPAGG